MNNLKMHVSELTEKDLIDDWNDKRTEWWCPVCNNDMPSAKSMIRVYMNSLPSQVYSGLLRTMTCGEYDFEPEMLKEIFEPTHKHKLVARKDCFTGNDFIPSFEVVMCKVCHNSIMMYRET